MHKFLQFISRVRLRLTREMKKKNQNFRVSASELKNHTHHRTLFLTIGLLLLLFVALAKEEGIFGTTLPWYTVEPWEVEVCAKWGGRTEPTQGTVELGLTPYGDMTMTVQGKRTKTKPGQYLYEISYYLESFGATTTYHIDLVNPVSQQNKSITTGTLAPETGTADYLTEYLNESYTHIRLTHDRGIIITPIIDVR